MSSPAKKAQSMLPDLILNYEASEAAMMDCVRKVFPLGSVARTRVLKEFVVIESYSNIPHFVNALVKDSVDIDDPHCIHVVQLEPALVRSEWPQWVLDFKRKMSNKKRINTLIRRRLGNE